MIHVTDHQTDQIIDVIEDFWADTHKETIKNEETFDFTISTDVPVDTIRNVVNETVIPSTNIITHSISVATWNIHGGMDQSGKYINLSTNSRELIAGFDIVGLQELKVNYSKSISKDPIAAFSFPYGHFYKATTLSDEPTADYGIGALSESEMIGLTQYTLPNTTGSEVRILSQAETTINGKKIYIFNTHLRFDDDSIRTQQMQFIKEKLDALNGESFVLFGDFNIRDVSEFDIFTPSYQMVNGFNGVYYDSYNLDDWTTRKLDNIICSKDLTIKSTGLIQTTLSDHSVLHAQLEWTETTIQTIKNYVVSSQAIKVQPISERNRVIIPDEDGFYREFIIEESIQKSDKTKEVYTIGSFTELAKQKIIEPITRSGDTVNTALDWALTDTEWQRGITEFSGSRSITIDEVSNALDVLKKIASVFGLEIRFRVEIQGNYVYGRYVDMVKQKGQYRGKEIVLGKDLIGVTRKENTAEICTALHCVGPVKEDGTRLTVKLYDEDALKRWGRNGKHLWGYYEPETENTDMTLDRLTTLGNNELSKRISSVVKYEVDAASIEYVFGYEHEKVRIGDTVRIKDTSFEPVLFLEARVLSVQRSPKDKTQKSFVLGDFIDQTNYTVQEIKKNIKLLQAKVATDLSGSSINKGTINPDKVIIQNSKVLINSDGLSAENNAFTVASLINGWSIYGAGSSSEVYYYPAYMKDPLGMVHIRGSMKGGTNNRAFTLPVGMRPAFNLYYSVVCGTNTIGAVTIKPDGGIYVNVPSNSYVSLDNIPPFLAEG